jgi:hypothetical protein
VGHCSLCHVLTFCRAALQRLFIAAALCTLPYSVGVQNLTIVIHCSNRETNNFFLK